MPRRGEHAGGGKGSAEAKVYLADFELYLQRVLFLVRQFHRDLHELVEEAAVHLRASHVLFDEVLYFLERHGLSVHSYPRDIIELSSHGTNCLNPLYVRGLYTLSDNEECLEKLIVSVLLQPLSVLEARLSTAREELLSAGERKRPELQNARNILVSPNDVRHLNAYITDILSFVTDQFFSIMAALYDHMNYSWSIRLNHTEDGNTAAGARNNNNDKSNSNSSSNNKSVPIRYVAVENKDQAYSKKVSAQRLFQSIELTKRTYDSLISVTFRCVKNIETVFGEMRYMGEQRHFMYSTISEVASRVRHFVGAGYRKFFQRIRSQLMEPLKKMGWGWLGPPAGVPSPSSSNTASALCGSSSPPNCAMKLPTNAPAESTEETGNSNPLLSRPSSSAKLHSGNPWGSATPGTGPHPNCQCFLKTLLIDLDDHPLAIPFDEEAEISPITWLAGGSSGGGGAGNGDSKRSSTIASLSQGGSSSSSANSTGNGASATREERHVSKNGSSSAYAIVSVRRLPHFYDFTALIEQYTLYVDRLPSHMSVFARKWATPSMESQRHVLDHATFFSPQSHPNSNNGKNRSPLAHPAGSGPGAAHHTSNSPTVIVPLLNNSSSTRSPLHSIPVAGGGESPFWCTPSPGGDTLSLCSGRSISPVNGDNNNNGFPSQSTSLSPKKVEMPTKSTRSNSKKPVTILNDTTDRKDNPDSVGTPSSASAKKKKKLSSGDKRAIQIIFAMNDISSAFVKEVSEVFTYKGNYTPLCSRR